jgi:hypothetical protein
MKIDWGASYFFSLILMFYLMAWFKPSAEPIPGTGPRAAATAEYRPNTTLLQD